MKGKDSFKGMPSRKAKGKGDGKNKGGKQFQQPPQASVAQQASSSTSQTSENQKLPRPRKAGVMIMIPIGQMTGQHGNPITDMMEILPRWLVQLLLLGNWPLQRTSVQNIFKTFLCTDRRTKTTGSVFLLFACSDISGTNSCPSWLTCFCLCRCCTSASKIWAGNHFRASGSLKRASQPIPVTSIRMNNTRAHSIPILRRSVYIWIMIMVPSKHSCVSTWILVLIRLMWFLTQVVPEPWVPALR